MPFPTRITVWTLVVVIALVVAGCGGSRPASSDPGDAQGSDAPLPTRDPNATLVPPGQIDIVLADGIDAAASGLMALDDQQFDLAENIEISLTPADPGADPFAGLGQTDGSTLVLASAAAALEAPAHGADPVLVAQVTRRPDLSIVTTTAGPKTLAALAHATVAVPAGASGAAARAILGSAGLTGVKVVPLSEPFNPSQLTGGQVEAVAVRDAYEWATLVAGSSGGADSFRKLWPASGATKLPMDLGLFVDGKWLADPANATMLPRFLRAAARGYAFCREAVPDCAQLVLDTGSPRTLDAEVWATNSIDSLTWPSPDGWGAIDRAAWSAAVDAAKAAGLISTAPPSTAVNSQLIKDADAAVKDVDIVGASFAPSQVPLPSPGASAPDTGPSDEPIVTLPPAP
jgi:NitT/TauT family transport system substrate-binding protein